VVFIYVLFGIYLLAVNFYGILLMSAQKKARTETDEKGVSDARVFVAAFLGGTLGVYLYMLIKKWRLTSLHLVVFLPLVFALNVYLIYMAISYRFGFAMPMV